MTNVRLALAIILGTLLSRTGTAQSTPVTSPASPEKAFIGNAGGDFGTGLHVEDFGGNGGERAYNEFFLAMKQWGHFEIVSNPAHADWLFEINVRNEQTCDYRYSRRREHEPVHNDYRIDLLMTDARTGAVRKRFSESLATPQFFSNTDKIFDQGIVALIDDVKQVVGEAVGRTPLAAHNQPMAPPPSGIALAQKIHIDNQSPSDAGTQRYSGGTAYVYDEFAADLKRWGRYELVPAADADLVFEISFSAPEQCAWFDDPQLNLTIVDFRSKVVLWTFTRHLGHTLLAGNARKDFSQAMKELVDAIRDIAERPAWGATASFPASTVTSTAATPLIAAGGQSTVPAIPVTISIPSPAIKSGSDVRVHVTVKNSSKQDFKFIYPSGDPLKCDVAVRRLDGSMSVETQDGAKAREAHASWRGSPMTYSLRPGETQTRDCEVSSLYDMTQPGKYLIDVRQLDGKAVQSNVLAVTIAP